MRLKPRLSDLSLTEIGCGCAEENRQFAAGENSSSGCCFELFYRAHVLEDDDAWTLLFQQFEPQVKKWVKQSRMLYLTNETADYFVNEAFARMFKALHGLDKTLFLRRFTNIGMLLGYLKRCANTALQDAAAKSGNRIETIELNEEIARGNDAYASIEESELQQEFWQRLERHFDSDFERHIFYDTYVLNLKTPQILDKYAEVDEAQQIFRIRARILRRLRKDAGLAQFLK